MTPVLQRIGGDIAEAVAETIHVAFFVDGEVVITEHGPAVCAVVDVLMIYLEKYPKHPSLKKWVKRIGDVARKMGNCDHDSELVSPVAFFEVMIIKVTTPACFKKRPSKGQY